MKGSEFRTSKPSWQVHREYHDNLKKQLWLNNPRCFYCGIVTVFSRRHHGSIADDYPTIEHIYPITDLRRLCIDGGKKRVIACNKCNNEKSIQSAKLVDKLFYQKLDIFRLFEIIPFSDNE